jgi:hypothetical protein
MDTGKKYGAGTTRDSLLRKAETITHIVGYFLYLRPLVIVRKNGYTLFFLDPPDLSGEIFVCLNFHLISIEVKLLGDQSGRMICVKQATLFGSAAA